MGARVGLLVAGMGDSLLHTHQDCTRSRPPVLFGSPALPEKDAWDPDISGASYLSKVLMVCLLEAVNEGSHSSPDPAKFTLLQSLDCQMEQVRDYSRCVLRHPGAGSSLRQRSFADTLDQRSIIHSPSFTFLVGPRHTKLTIQSGLAQHVSKPLHNLMNNGHTRESRHRIAVLEDEDVETFVAFCEYAYAGDYKVPSLPRSFDEAWTGLGVAESVTSSGRPWRESNRSDSISSAVPPPAPSPPPESLKSDTQTAKTHSEHDGLESNPMPEIVKEEPTQEVTESESMPTGGSTETERTLASDEQESPMPPPEDGDGTLDPGTEDGQDEWGSWPVSTLKKSKKSKKKKRQQQMLPEEPLANLTPPSTPPPEVQVGSDDVSPDETPETPVEETVTQDETPEEEQEPVCEPTAEPVLDPITEEREQSSTPAPNDDVSILEQEGEDQDTLNEADEPHEAASKPFIDMSFAKQSDSLSPRTPGLSLWDEFTALEYNDEQPVTSVPPTAVEVSTPDLPYLTFHAKVYVFATRYLIPALAQLCLRKLHNDLVHLSFIETDGGELMPDTHNLTGLAARQAPLILDLLRYAYTKTTRLEPISPTSATQLRENELRRLVVHYAACKVKELARYHSSGDSGTATPPIRRVDVKMERGDEAPPKSLRALLDMTPELASDLVYRMM